ncbi:MAG: cation-translocating P-type ATPase [Oscillospiraceae bacterium]|nr:cation-translocating P-type ATPase [Oscillospiraceae bacterium]
MQRQDIPRFSPPVTQGLTAEQVKSRVDAGLSNKETGTKTKTYRQIVLENTFTFFNILNFILALAVLLVGSYKNLLFMGVIVCNICIGTFQGIRAKRTIDKLSLIAAPKAGVIRDGQRMEIAVEELVLDDVLCLSAGKQICADAVVAEGEAEVNESLLTGESDPVLKRPGDTLLSGSFVVSGVCAARVTHVGNENYAAQLAKDARYVKKPNSEIMRSLDFIVKTISAVLAPVGLLLFCKQYFLLHTGLQQSVIRTVAALIGMIPEGLVLLTSMVFAVSVLRLSRHKTLAQELYCVETLARVDVLCLDKTGTITEGCMQLDGLVPLQDTPREEMEAALSLLSGALTDDNATFLAVREAFPSAKAEAVRTVPFSSARKWSGAAFEGRGSYLLGAGEFMMGEAFAPYAAAAASYAEEGRRVLLLAHSSEELSARQVLPAQLKPLGFLLFSDKLRAEAPDTLAYFAKQGVALKIISGDSAVTAAHIAKRAGMTGWENYIDASLLQDEAALQDAAERYQVFGRVTPRQKLSLVKALKNAGHTVAMTGDGVNDVLALKEADCSVAMASGSDAARTVADLVLLDSNFASLPKVVQEGRRSINNLQRSAALFLTKTIFSVFLSFFFLFIAAPYPFHPIQLTLISALTIGLPSFVLALEPNSELVRGRFLINVFQKAVPAACGMLGSVLALVCLTAFFPLSVPAFSTLAVYTTAAAGFLLLFRLCRPFNPLRLSLFIITAAAFCIVSCCFGPFFSLVPLDLFSALTLLGLFACVALFFYAGHRLLGWLLNKASCIAFLKKFWGRVFPENKG